MPFRTRFRAFLRGLALPACVLFSASTAHAGPVDPPMELLYGKGNLLIVGTVAEVNPTGRVVFTRKEVLGGKPKPPALVDVGVPPSVLAAVKPGERYVVGYSAYRTNRKLNALVANLDGPTLLVSPGLEPALLRDTPVVRTLLKVGRSESGRESRRFRELLLGALKSGDPQLQNLAAGEITLNAEIRARIGEPELLQRVARDARTPLTTRALLLQAAAEHPEQLGTWWQAVATEIVTSTPVDGYSSASLDPFNLVMTAMDALDQQGKDVGGPALERWLRAANPALSERAALALRKQQSPQRERTAVREAIADPATPAATRQFLEAHLRRLDRLDAHPPTRTQGSH